MIRLHPLARRLRGRRRLARVLGPGRAEYLAWLGEEPADYTVLMGANTYRLMSRLGADGEPGTDVLAGMFGYPDVSLDMVSSRLFDGRLQLLEYVPTVLDGPPGR